LFSFIRNLHQHDVETDYTQSALSGLSQSHTLQRETHACQFQDLSRED